MATDAYGLSDMSLLTGPQQTTANTIQTAFNNSLAANQRNLARYPMLAQTSGPMIQSMAEDSALARAAKTSDILNQNEQIQKLIDAANHTPHGIQENLAAYLPTLGALQYALPALFGNSASLASNGGLFGLASKGVDKVVHWFTDPRTGQKYPLDGTGKLIDTTSWDSGNSWNPAATGAVPWDSGNSWNPAAATTGATTFPMDFGTAADNASYGFNVVNDTASTATDWLSNFMP